ncbi:SDR family oxidoreductase [Castellaniella sp.]|uniref:SDR family oxidoreductase n=1 Tax=Castellaniella sp. TaxID=1955812 RepID=UPI0035668B9D
MARRKNVALVVGATGVVGRNLLGQLLRDQAWDVIALSRRKPDLPGAFRHLSVDLLSSESLASIQGALADVTHVFYAAYVEKPTWADMVEPNLRMLSNLMAVLEPVASGLRHVSLMQGTKWYGNHLGPFKIPAKESDPRHMPPNFYYDQHDYIVGLQRGKAWSWSAARPHAVCGFAHGNPMNLVIVLAVYASISRALGLPLRHPGSEASARSLYNVTDSGLLARASIWMATDERAANEAFNITNGDVFRWQSLWSDIAHDFGMDVAPPQKIDLVQMMADKKTLWEDLVRRHDLQPIPYGQLVSWAYGDYVFAAEYDVISSTTKARQFGFTEAQDSTEMFLRHFDELRRARIIP